MSKPTAGRKCFRRMVVKDAEEKSAEVNDAAPKSRNACLPQ
jgi:hypothetical protein